MGSIEKKRGEAACCSSKDVNGMKLEAFEAQHDADNFHCSL
jgi:hypothetical protein